MDGWNVALALSLRLSCRPPSVFGSVADPVPVILAATVCAERPVPQAETMESGETTSLEFAPEALVTVGAWPKVSVPALSRHVNIMCGRILGIRLVLCTVFLSYFVQLLQS